MFRNRLKAGLAGALSIATVLSSLSGPAQALPRIAAPTGAEAAADALVVDADAKVRFGFHVYRGHPYYNGHRGFPYRRPGWRPYNGWWFPPAAFGLGLLLAPPAPGPAALSRAHYDWCFRKYRSYRAYDNTFQPYHGPRKQCRSPYWP